MDKVQKVIHWSATVLISLLMLASASMYIIDHEEVAKTFEVQLGFPTWLLYPMAVAKYSAVIMILTKFNRSLTEWAYAGLTFNLLLAVGAHVAADDQQVFPAMVALLLVLISYFTWKRILPSKSAAEEK